ncbi:hypothetical protein FB451DRAFT_1527807 [Mycena latifolia]|nr:hypothetical protein FB451DRAFT_1527807 [Mycena latifolia]
MADVRIYCEHTKIKTKLPARCKYGLSEPADSTFSPPTGTAIVRSRPLGMMPAQTHVVNEPEEEYTLHLGAESMPIDAMHIPAAPPPVPVAPPRTRSWRSSSHAADTAAARASAYDAAGNLKIAARKARTSAGSGTRPSSPRGNSLLIFSAVHMSSLHSPPISPAIFFPPFSALHDTTITDDCVRADMLRRLGPLDLRCRQRRHHHQSALLRRGHDQRCAHDPHNHLKSFPFVNMPRAVARRHTAHLTSLEAEAMAVASSSSSRSISHPPSASYAPPPVPSAPLSTQSIRSTALTPPIRTPLMPPRHRAIAPLLPPLPASPARPVRRAPRRA